ncbi:MAG TPA: hypothetical protein VI819_03975 [Patescibacteria group bacterium]|nr:hypothetical protein [Patescibacteria group bacterium]
MIEKIKSKAEDFAYAAELSCGCALSIVPLVARQYLGADVGDRVYVHSKNQGAASDVRGEIIEYGIHKNDQVFVKVLDKYGIVTEMLLPKKGTFRYDGKLRTSFGTNRGAQVMAMPWTIKKY